jgi:hypothetical protein
MSIKARKSELWRRERDSNPRFRSLGITVFKTAAFNRSAISPIDSVCHITRDRISHVSFFDKNSFENSRMAIRLHVRFT